MNKQSEKTIAAIATPSGVGAIAIIRISGAKAYEIAFSVIKTKAKIIKPNYLYLATLDTGSIKDEVMAVYFKAPKSYTGEDVVEIHCHGSSFIKNEIMRVLIKKGCTQADSGEFTKRAFLNGRITLPEAESVIDLINSESEAQVNAAFFSLKGSLSNKIIELQDKIISTTASASAAIDYPEEGLEETTKESINKFLDKTLKELEELLSSYNSGRIIKEGIRVVLAGEPNVGKSMLLNRLLGFDRAIVTDIEGTTRDTLEEYFFYKGIKFILTDTAGLRETGDLIEKLGIQRSMDALKSADIILCITEYGKNATVNKELFGDKNVIYVVNKIDKADKNNNVADENKTINISAKENINIDKLKDLMIDLVGGEKIFAGGVALNNIRHYNAIKDAFDALNNAKQNLEDMPIDCIIADLDHGYRSLGLVSGKTASDEIVSEIFARFCVGK